jgi:hypothetical protein
MDPFDPKNTGNPNADKARRLIDCFAPSLMAKASMALASRPDRPVAGLIAELGTDEHTGHFLLAIPGSVVDEPLPGLIVAIADLKLIARIMRQTMGEAFSTRFLADNRNTPDSLLIYCALKSGAQSAIVRSGKANT